MMNNDEISPGDPVRYWLPWGSLAGQRGTVESVKKLYGTVYAEIIPEERESSTIHLFRGAVWGFEPLRD